MQTFNANIESAVPVELENTFKNIGWRQSINGFWTKPFIALNRIHSSILAKAEIQYITNGQITDPVIDSRINYELCPFFKWRLIPPGGRPRTYRYEGSALRAKRRLGGQLFKAVDHKEIWQPVD